VTSGNGQAARAVAHPTALADAESPSCLRHHRLRVSHCADWTDIAAQFETRRFFVPISNRKTANVVETTFSVGTLASAHATKKTIICC